MTLTLKKKTMTFDFTNSENDKIQEVVLTGGSKPPEQRVKDFPGKMEYVKPYVEKMVPGSPLSVSIDWLKTDDGAIPIAYVKWSDGVYCAKKKLLQFAYHVALNPRNLKHLRYRKNRFGPVKRLPVTNLAGKRQIQLHHPELLLSDAIPSVDGLIDHMAFDCLVHGNIKRFKRSWSTQRCRKVVPLLNKNERLDEDNPDVKDLLKYINKVDFIERGNDGKFTLFFVAGDNHYVGQLGGVSSHDDVVVDCLMAELVNDYVSTRDDISFDGGHTSYQLLLDHIKYNLDIRIGRFEKTSDLEKEEAYDYE